MSALAIKNQSAMDDREDRSSNTGSIGLCSAAAAATSSASSRPTGGAALIAGAALLFAAAPRPAGADSAFAVLALEALTPATLPLAALALTVLALEVMPLTVLALVALPLAVLALVALALAVLALTVLALESLTFAALTPPAFTALFSDRALGLRASEVFFSAGDREAFSDDPTSEALAAPALPLLLAGAAGVASAFFGLPVAFLSLTALVLAVALAVFSTL
ncbi:hypothetical protein LJB99_03085, partial [Deltaproteobacteria bacterium OttesenSCG-928-K17]|nr:hypothetical protein [Deltaproteobacteria bacterium OttesenSCG-928-K17]